MSSPSSIKFIATIFFIIVCTFISFLPSLNAQFLFWDDFSHLVSNEDVRSLKFNNIAHMFNQTIHNTYIPLTTLSFAIEYYFFKHNPFVYHFDNLILHSMVTALIFLFAQKLNFNFFTAACASLFFGIHPMHVESVAWVTARKDVLYGTFYLLSLLYYWQYIDTKRINVFFISIIFGCLSMLAKPMALSLPLIFFLVDWYKERSFNIKLVLEKTVHFLYIVPIGWITYSFYARTPGEGIFEAILVWVWTFSFYLEKFFIPLNFSPLYQLPEPISLFYFPYLKAFIIFFITLGALIRFRKNRLFVFAVFYYFFSIFFLLRFDKTVDLTIVADRYMYMPSVGFCLFVGCVFGKFLERLKQKGQIAQRVGCTVLILIYLTLSIKTFHQSKIWQNNIKLWTHVIKLFPNNVHAYANRANANIGRQQWAQAKSDLNKALMLDPNHAKALNNLGILYREEGKLDDALKSVHKAIQSQPHFMGAYLNRGMIYQKLNQHQSAVDDFTKALRMPALAIEAYTQRAISYRQLGRCDQAIGDYSRVLKREKNALVYYNRGNCYLETNQLLKAASDYTSAIKLNPKFDLAYHNRGNVYKVNGQHIKAISDYTQALQINNKFTEALYSRSKTYAALGQWEEALEDAYQLIDQNVSNLDEYINQLKKFKP